MGANCYCTSVQQRYYCTYNKECIAPQTEEILEGLWQLGEGEKKLFFSVFVCVWLDLKHLSDKSSLNR